MLQFSSHNLRCYNSAPTISNVTIQLPQSQILQFNSHKLRCYNSTPTKSGVAVQLPKSHVLQFSSHNLMCYNSLRIIWWRFCACPSLLPQPTNFLTIYNLIHLSPTSYVPTDTFRGIYVSLQFHFTLKQYKHQKRQVCRYVISPKT